MGVRQVERSRIPTHARRTPHHWRNGVTTTERRTERAADPTPPSRPAEESALARVASWCHDHRWWVLVAWIVTLVAVNVVGPGSREQLHQQSRRVAPQTAQQILNADFPGVVGQSGPGRDHDRRAPSPTPPTSPARTIGRRPSPLCPMWPRWPVPSVAAGAAQISRDGHVAYVRVYFDEQTGNLPTARIKQVIATAQSFDAPGLPRGPRRSGHRPGRRGQARARRGHRHPRRHHHHAPGLRLGGGHGPAHHHRRCSASPWPSPCSTCCPMW